VFNNKVGRAKKSGFQILTGAIAAASMAVPALAQPVQQQDAARQVAELRNTPSLSNSDRLTSDILRSLLSGKKSAESAVAPYCQFTQCKDGCQHTQTCSGPVGAEG
jgi:hypothetical protein